MMYYFIYMIMFCYMTVGMSRLMLLVSSGLILFISMPRSELPFSLAVLTRPLPIVDFSVATDILLVVSHLCLLISKAALISLLRIT